MTALERVRRNYRASFLRYLPRREEAALLSGYDLGHEAVEQGVSLLDLVQVHHEVLLGVLQDTAAEELATVAEAASSFLTEVLATYEMSRRAGRGANGQTPST